MSKYIYIYIYIYIHIYTLLNVAFSILHFTLTHFFPFIEFILELA